MNKTNKAIFLDRDGVLLKDTHLITKIDQAEIFEDAFSFIKTVKELGFLVFLISNQTVVARGLLTKSEMQSLNNEILTRVLNGSSPAEYFTKVYICPHHPNATIDEFRLDCTFRKPRNGMILNAAKEYQLDLKQSWVIGDRVSDIAAGNSSGCSTIQLSTGQHDSQMIESSMHRNVELEVPTYKAASLSNALQTIEASQKEAL
ncbi:MAG: D-glycero-D-manno-heptose 1,7-bisphosphate phosphatase [Bacteriovoracaceae bacterium]|jgi:D-glycero-D-manno-heptose 1,7-bisphosphate phosphatase